MTRAVRFAAVTALVVVSWILLLLDVLPLPFLGDKEKHEILPTVG